MECGGLEGRSNRNDQIGVGLERRSFVARNRAVSPDCGALGYVVYRPGLPVGWEETWRSLETVERLSVVTRAHAGVAGG